MATVIATAPPRAEKSHLSYYYGSIISFIVAIAAGFYIGGPQTAFIVAVLAVLETSLSLDNAVVNAKVLENWDEKWRDIFLRYGIWVAVFGMRIVFPIAIVSVITGIAPFYLPGVWDENVLSLALHEPDKYAALLTAAHPQIAGFGAAFLLMVALNFFFEEKHVYWLEWAETKLTHFGQIEGISVAVTLGILLFARGYVEASHAAAFFGAGIWGIITYVITHGLGTLLGGSDDEDEGIDATTSAGAAGGTVIKAGLAGFLYLEVLDASFSFDGVIGAFALTNYLITIALGLGVGAFFVRSFTIHLVDTGVMGEYRYLEHGAFYAILSLATIMLVSATGYELPEWFTGLLGAAVLGLALGHSVLANKRDAKSAAATA